MGRKIIFNVQIHKIDDNILEYSCTLPSIVITECCDLPVCNTCHHLKHDHHCHFCQGNLTNVVHLTERKDLEKNLNQKLMVNFYYFFINPQTFKMSEDFVQCSGCKHEKISLSSNHLFVMKCNCTIGLPFCLNCYCASLSHIKKGYPPRITCPWCSKAGLIRPNRNAPRGAFRFFKSFQQRSWWYMHSKTLFVRISSDWRVFSRYYRDDFLSLTSHNLQTIEMMYSLHQLFFLSQMNLDVGPPTRIQLICNPWEKNPQSQFTLKILRINLARKLVCKLFATGASETLLFSRKMMHKLLMYLMAHL